MELKGDISIGKNQKNSNIVVHELLKEEGQLTKLITKHLLGYNLVSAIFSEIKI